MVRCTSADFIFLVNFYAHLTPNQGDIIYHAQEHYLFKNTRVPPRPAAAGADFWNFARAPPALNVLEDRHRARPCDTTQRNTRILSKFSNTKISQPHL